MIKMAVVEDNPNTRDGLVKYLNRFAKEQNCSIDVQTYSDGSAILQNFHPGFDAIFLDIEMPQMNGMEAAAAIREKDDQVVLVFITNMGQYAIRGYEVGATDFMLKPLSYETFHAKMPRILKQAERIQGDSITLQLDGEIRKLSTKDILYVELIGHQLHYHTLEKTYEIRGSIKAAEELLDGKEFVKCNSGYLVNLRHIKAVRDGMVYVGEEKLAISRSRKKEVMQKVAEYIGGI